MADFDTVRVSGYFSRFNYIFMFPFYARCSGQVSNLVKVALFLRKRQAVTLIVAIVMHVILPFRFLRRPLKLAENENHFLLFQSKRD